MLNLTPTVRNLLLLNAVVFLLQTATPFGSAITQWGSLYPLGSPYFYVWQFVTYMFLHANLSHIMGNMFGLFSFGPMLEQRWGGRRFLTFWLVCGIGAGVLYEGVRVYDSYQLNEAYTEFKANPGGVEYQQFMKRSGVMEPADEAAARALAINRDDQVLRANLQDRVNYVYNAARNGSMLGASGALFGVLFAFAYLFPNTELILLFFPIPIKAKYFVLLYGAYELYAGVHRAPGDTVAHFAHLGGLLVAFIILKFWERGRARFY